MNHFQFIEINKIAHKKVKAVLYPGIKLSISARKNSSDSRPRQVDPEYGFKHFSGTGLAFIAVADAIAVMPGGPFWAVLFFLMLLTLGLGSAFGTLEGFITPMFNLLGKIL